MASPTVKLRLAWFVFVCVGIGKVISQRGLRMSFLADENFPAKLTKEFKELIKI
jgi:hypothetical protein